MDRPARALRLGAAWLAVGAVWLLAPTAAQGDESLGLSPGRYDVPTAQPGEAYVRELHLQNQFDDASDIEVTFQGEAGEWASTDPGGTFTVPPRSSRTVTLTVQVPGEAGPGSHQGQVTFTTEPKEQPDGSGAAIRHGVGLLLNVTVGGEPVVRLEWLSARVEDAEQGQPVLAYVLVRNDGNVRAQPEAEGQVLPFDADEPVLSQGSGASALRPGEQGEVEVVFPAGLEVGQYRARLSSLDGAFTDTLPFKVVPPGIQAPDGVLRAIVHEPRARAGDLVRVEAWFENTGTTTIQSARFFGEVEKSGKLVKALESEAVAVPPGGHANLTAYVRPGSAGTYTITGHVNYDGYLTLEAESRLEVSAKGFNFPWWWLLVALLVVAAAILLWKTRRKRRKGVN